MDPRPVYEDDCIFITRRVHGREFRLLQTPQTKELVGYVLSVLVARYGIEICAVCVMSNHWHAQIYDPLGNVSSFTRDFHHFVTKGLNEAYGDEGSMWDSAQTSHVHPEEPDDVIGRIAYAMANPVKAGIVKNIKDYPGICLRWPQPAVKFVRPDLQFFGGKRKKKKKRKAIAWPETATLQLHRPHGFSEVEEPDLEELIEARVKTVEAEARKKGRTFLGVSGLLAQSRYARPAKKKPDEKPEGAINPRVACRDAWRRVERLQLNRYFVDELARCRKAFLAGDRDVVFPHGTYKMRIHHGVNVAPPPT
jgi:REP element-mobilizing transposase RayT